MSAILRNSLTRTAKFYGDQGCMLHPEDYNGIYYDPAPVETSLPETDTQLRPMGNLLPDDPLSPEVDEEKLRAAVELAFDVPAQTSAMAVVYKGCLVAERYAPGVTKDTLLESWSMGKSLTGTLIGRLMLDGHFGLEDLAPVPEWQQPDDPRREIRMADLLRMSSGLQFTLYEVLEQTSEGTYRIGTDYPDHYFVYALHDGRVPVRCLPTPPAPSQHGRTLPQLRSLDAWLYRKANCPWEGGGLPDLSLAESFRPNRDPPNGSGHGSLWQFHHVGL